MSTSLGLRASHIALIAKRHAKYSIRGGSGLVFALASLLTGLLIAQIFIGIVEQVQEITQMDVAKALESASETSAKVIQFATGGDDERLSKFLAEKPTLISAFLLVLMFVLPYLVSLGAFNQTSGDISSKGLRYLLLRTERSNIFVGRFLGTLIFVSASLVFLMIIVTMYLSFKFTLYDTSEVVLWMTWGTAAIILYSIPCIALFSWISCSIDSPFGSLVLGQLVFGALPILVFIGKRYTEHAKYGNFILPSGFKFFLFHPDIKWLLVGILAMLAFTVLFLFLGMRSFQKRDL